MNAAVSRPSPASRIPSIPPVPPVAPPAPDPRLAPPTPRALAARAVGEAAAVLAAEESCLVVAHEWIADAERTHSRPVTMRRRGVDVVVIAGTPFTPERMAERRAYAAARVQECKGRVAAADEALAEARRVPARVAS